MELLIEHSTKVQRNAQALQTLMLMAKNGSAEQSSHVKMTAAFIVQFYWNQIDKLSVKKDQFFDDKQ